MERWDVWEGMGGRKNGHGWVKYLCRIEVMKLACTDSWMWMSRVQSSFCSDSLFCLLEQFIMSGVQNVPTALIGFSQDQVRSAKLVTGNHNDHIWAKT